MKIAEKREANKAAHESRDRNSDDEGPAAEADTDETPVVPPETAPA